MSQPAETAPLVLEVGRQSWPLSPRPGTLVPLSRAEPPSAGADPASMLREALERPLGLGAPLYRALTPDDSAVVVLDEGLPHAAGMLAGLMRHLMRAGVPPERMTVVVPPGAGKTHPWMDDLPDDLSDVRLEVHDLEDRAKLAYLAATRSGERVYLNRTLVEAGFVAVLSRVRFDPTFGTSGGESAIYPALGEPEAVAKTVGKFALDTSGEAGAEPRKVAGEVAYLLGSPFFVRVIAGPGDGIHGVVCGLTSETPAALKLHDAVWRATAGRPADLVIATIGGDPARVTFQDMALALAGASRAVKPGGRVVLLTEAAPELGEGAELLRDAREPDEVPMLLKRRKPDDWPAAALWLSAVRQGSVFVASGFADALAEDLFVTPLRSPTELQRLADVAETVLVVPDAHRVALEVE